MIDEIKEQLHGNTPDNIVVAVRGGGLMCGVCQGLRKVGWGQVPVVAMETLGRESLNCCVRENEWSQLNDITRYVIVCVRVCVCACVCVVTLW